MQPYNININELLGNNAQSNLYAFAIWGTVGLIVFAVIYLFYGAKKVKKGEKPSGAMATIIKWALLFASAGFNVFFTYYVFLPSGQGLALAMALVMGGVNLAEAYLVRLTLASWRHDLKAVFRIAMFLIIPLFAYSLMSAGSSFTTMMNKNKDSMRASKLELSASNDKINALQAKVKEVQAGEQGGFMLASLQGAQVRNSQGRRVSFGRIKRSCETGGYYALNYPRLCGQYAGLKDGTYKAGDVARAEQVASLQSSSEKLKMAQILKDRPPEIMPTLLGFSLGFAFVGFIVSLALESAIVGIGFFEELFINPTVLPAILSFKDKKLDWDEKGLTQGGLRMDKTPHPSISLNTDNLTNPYSSNISTPAPAIEGRNPAPDTTTEGGAPKQGRTYPLQNAGGEGGAPKQGRNQECHTPQKQGGAVRTKETPDTGTTGDSAHRYNALKKAIKNGDIDSTYRGIKSFKYGGHGMGDSTVRNYMQALRTDGIIPTDNAKKKRG